MEQTRAAAIALIADVTGIHPVSTPAELRDLVGGLDFFWLDVPVDDGMIRAELLAQLALDPSDVSWALRFGQTLRVVIDRRGARVVTWVTAREGDVAEVHVLCSERCIATVWSGDASVLDDARAQFADRLAELKKSRFHAVAIVLQLLLGTLDQTISRLDTRLDEVRQQLQPGNARVDLATVTHQLHGLQSRWAEFDRYASAVRTAMVGVEAVPGMDVRGAQELNHYARQVGDTKRRLWDRSVWGSSIVQDYAAAIAQRQGEQINRLTLVSLIFLPITFITGYFGMNFTWMINLLGNARAFLALGLALPALSVVVTVVWLRRRQLL